MKGMMMMGAQGPTGAQGYPYWSSYSAVADVSPLSYEEIYCDTADSGAFTVYLPIGPSVGDRVRVIDSVGNFGTDNLTVDGNGANIRGAATKILSTNYGSAEFVYNGVEWSCLISS